MSCNCSTKEACYSSTCSCPIKDFPSDCIKVSAEFSCSEIESDQTLTETLEQLDAFICEKFDFLTEYLQLVNVGNGAKVYKGASITGQKQLRTIKSQDTTLLDINEFTDTIEILAGKYDIELEDDILSLIVNTITEGDTVVGTVDLSGYVNVDSYVTGLSFDEGTSILTVTRNNGLANLTVDLSYLENTDKFLSSAAFNNSTNQVELTMNDASVITVTIPSATETIDGILEVATIAEANALTADDKIITPAKLPIASETQQGLAEIATQVEVDAGIDNIRYVTPATLSNYVADAISASPTINVTSVTIGTWTENDAITVSHNIGSQPIMAFLKAVCTSAVGNYSVGDVVTLTQGGHQYEDGGNGTTGGISLEISEVNDALLLTTNRIYVVDKDGTGTQRIQPANWDIVAMFMY